MANGCENMLSITNCQGNANETTITYHLTLERQQVTSVGEGMEKREAL